MGKIEKKTLSLEIIDEIEKMIKNGDIKPGESLPSERELSVKLGVSRPPIREAFHALRALGIIDIHIGGGAYLRENVPVITEHFKTKALLTRYTTMELAEARIVIEMETVSLAIKRASDEILKGIGEFVLLASECPENDVDKFLEYDFNFHKAIADAAENFVLGEMLETTRGLMHDVNVMNLLKPGHRENSLLMHQKIYNAIVSRDEALAKLLMREHIQTIQNCNDYFTEE